MSAAPALSNTTSFGYVRNMFSPRFFPLGMPAKTEQGVEFNPLLDVLPMLPLQPAVQYYANVRGGAQVPSVSDSEQT